MTLTKKFAVMAFIIINGLAFKAAAERIVRLSVGQSENIMVPGTITKVQVLNPSIADVASYSTRGATVVGVNSGNTEVLITTSKGVQKYTVVVTAVELGRLFKQVRAYLGRIEGIYPRVVEESVILSGAALTIDDYARADQAVTLFGNSVKNYVSFKPSAVQQINQVFHRNGLEEVIARAVGGTLFVEGSVGSQTQKQKVDALLRTYGLKSVENLVGIGGGSQILIDVQFVEMRKQGLHRLGIQWPSVAGMQVGGELQATIPITPAGTTAASLKIEAPLMETEAAINLLYTNGYARLLAQPKMVCASGKSAEFLVGGEVPIVVITNNVVSIDYKTYGIKLNIQPTADGFGNIQSEILAEVSEIDRSVMIQSVPGFRTRRFKTSVAAKNGSSIVLSGLFTNSEEKAVSKFPLLGHIPILGELFKSREFQEKKTTLIVFVTPRIVSPKHPWVRKTINEIQNLYEAYESEVGWQIFD